jgi:hypothetical protein
MLDILESVIQKVCSTMDNEMCNIEVSQKLISNYNCKFYTFACALTHSHARIHTWACAQTHQGLYNTSINFNMLVRYKTELD